MFYPLSHPCLIFHLDIYIYKDNKLPHNIPMGRHGRNFKFKSICSHIYSKNGYGVFFLLRLLLNDNFQKKGCYCFLIMGIHKCMCVPLTLLSPPPHMYPYKNNIAIFLIFCPFTLGIWMSPQGTFTRLFSRDFFSVLVITVKREPNYKSQEVGRPGDDPETCILKNIFLRFFKQFNGTRGLSISLGGF